MWSRVSFNNYDNESTPSTLDPSGPLPEPSAVQQHKHSLVELRWMGFLQKPRTEYEYHSSHRAHTKAQSKRHRHSTLKQVRPGILGKADFRKVSCRISIAPQHVCNPVSGSNFSYPHPQPPDLAGLRGWRCGRCKQSPGKFDKRGSKSQRIHLYCTGAPRFRPCRQQHHRRVVLEYRLVATAWRPGLMPIL